MVLRVCFDLFAVDVVDVVVVGVVVGVVVVVVVVGQVVGGLFEARVRFAYASSEQEQLLVEVDVGGVFEQRCQSLL